LRKDEKKLKNTISYLTLEAVVWVA
jgi:hypothetical protein